MARDIYCALVWAAFCILAAWVGETPQSFRSAPQAKQYRGSTGATNREPKADLNSFSLLAIRSGAGVIWVGKEPVLRGHMPYAILTRKAWVRAEWSRVCTSRTARPMIQRCMPPPPLRRKRLKPAFPNKSGFRCTLQFATVVECVLSRALYIDGAIYAPVIFGNYSIFNDGPMLGAAPWSVSTTSQSWRLIYICCDVIPLRCLLDTASIISSWVEPFYWGENRRAPWRLPA